LNLLEAEAKPQVRRVGPGEIRILDSTGNVGASFRSMTQIESCEVVIRSYDEAGNVIGTHEHAGVNLDLPISYRYASPAGSIIGSPSARIPFRRLRCTTSEP
jgi:hypothetical protein